MEAEGTSSWCFEDAFVLFMVAASASKSARKESMPLLWLSSPLACAEDDEEEVEKEEEERTALDFELLLLPRVLEETRSMRWISPLLPILPWSSSPSNTHVVPDTYTGGAGLTRLAGELGAGGAGTG